MPVAITLHVNTSVKAKELPRAALRRWLQRALAEQGVMAGAWSISLVDDAAMIELHDRTMNLPTTTDVLTFDLSDAPPKPARRGRKSKKAASPPPAPPLDLDTVICLDEARRRAAEQGHAVQLEVLLYAVHSLLHVCGYDDLTPAEARRMHRREDQILVALGVGRVFQKEKPGRQSTG